MNNAINLPSIGFRATLSAQLTNVTGNGTVVNMLYDTINHQTGGSNFSLATCIFTVPLTGYYIFTSQATISPHTSSMTTGSLSIKNGADVIAYDTFARGVAGENAFCVFNVKVVTYCTAGDQIITALVGSGGSMNADIIHNQGASFAGKFLGV